MKMQRYVRPKGTVIKGTTLVDEHGNSFFVSAVRDGQAHIIPTFYVPGRNENYNANMRGPRRQAKWRPLSEIAKEFKIWKEIGT